MISGKDLQAARGRARLSRAELGKRLGVSEKTVYNWEASGVPARSEGLVGDFIAEHVSASNPLAEYSDVALLAEVGRRMARGGQAWGGNPGSEDDGGGPTPAEQAERKRRGTTIRAADTPVLLDYDELSRRRTPDPRYKPGENRPKAARKRPKGKPKDEG